MVLIGAETAYRQWVQFEIAESVKRNNGLLGIAINHLEAPPFWLSSELGPFPHVPAPGRMPVYIWDSQNIDAFARLIEEAGARGDALRLAARQRAALSRPAPSAKAQADALLGLGGHPPVASTLAGLGGWESQSTPSPLAEALAKMIREGKFRR